MPTVTDLMARVNEECNRFPYVADPAAFDDWRPGDENGSDCDSYAVAKLRRLVAAGIPVESLRLACVYVETGEYHAVLIVETSEGSFMLDNRKPYPVPVLDLDVLGYTPDRIQEFGGSSEWVRWKGNEAMK